jgi:hypothetical protein
MAVFLSINAFSIGALASLSTVPHLENKKLRRTPIAFLSSRQAGGVTTTPRQFLETVVNARNCQCELPAAYAVRSGASLAVC